MALTNKWEQGGAIAVFTLEEDNKITNELARKFLPFCEGKIFNQIKLALEKCEKIAECSFSIRSVVSDSAQVENLSNNSPLISKITIAGDIVEIKYGDKKTLFIPENILISLCEEAILRATFQTAEGNGMDSHTSDKISQ